MSKARRAFRWESPSYAKLVRAIINSLVNCWTTCSHRLVVWRLAGLDLGAASVRTAIAGVYQFRLEALDLHSAVIGLFSASLSLAFQFDKNLLFGRPSI